MGLVPAPAAVAYDETSTSDNVIFMKLLAPLAAELRRTTNVASGKCFPVAAARAKMGDALPISRTKCRSWKLARPPRPELLDDWLTPQLKDSIGMASL